LLADGLGPSPDVAVFVYFGSYFFILFTFIYL
jgi:hypothetical protein